MTLPCLSTLANLAPRPAAGRGALAVVLVALAACGPTADAATLAGRPAAPPAAPSVDGRPAGSALNRALLDSAVARGAALPRLRSLLVSWRGELVAERYYRGAARDRPANIKSASKSVVSALAGVALAEGRLRGVDQPLAELLPGAVAALPPAQAAHVGAVTVADLLSMRAGLEPTSGPFYGRWVASGDWVQSALRRPVVAAAGHDGGPMLYSTGSTHVLGAALARATGASLHALYARALARPLGVTPRTWTADPQGRYFGGNEMRMTPREMVTFGRLYLEGGRAPSGTPAAGRQLVPRAWIDSSWAPRTRSPWSGEAYGYGWFSRDIVPAGALAATTHRVHYAWGYGGQFIFVVPSLDLVMVTTSDPDAPRDRGHLTAIHAILDGYVAPAVTGGGGRPATADGRG